MVTRLVVAVAALGGGLGAAGILWTLLPGDRSDKVGGETAARSRVTLVTGSALVAGIVAGLVAGWPIAVPAAALAVVLLARLRTRQGFQEAARRIEAVAVWSELLRDTLVASAGLNQAIVATADVAPKALQVEIGSLVDRIVSGLSLSEALHRFADEVADPSADLVVCALLLAAESRTQRLSDLLTTLAASIRDDVSMRLRVDAARSGTRSGVRTIILFSLGFMALLTVLAHSYLVPFRTVQGQVVLGFVCALYGSGVWLMARMARQDDPARLLGRQSAP